MNPDSLVKRYGKTATLIKLADISYNDYDEIDSSSSTFAEEEINIILSRPEESAEHRTEGLSAPLRIQGTVKSSIDIRDNRNGRADRIDLNASNTFPLSFPISFEYDDKIFEVKEVRSDKHPFANIRKQTVILEEMETRDAHD